MESYITVYPHIEGGIRKSCEERGQVDKTDNIQKLTYNHNKFATKKKTIMMCSDESDVLLSSELKCMLY